MAVRNRCFRIATLLLAATYLIVAARDLLGAAHIFQDQASVEAEIAVSVSLAAHLAGACGWATVATAFGPRIDWPRLLIGGIVIGSTSVALLVAAVLDLVPVLADTQGADIHGVYRWIAIGAILFTVGAAVIVAGLLESRRGPDLASRFQVGLVFATLSQGAVTVALLYQHSYDSSHHDPQVLTSGRLVTAIAQLGIALAALAFTLGVRLPLARREARLAGAAAGLALASICFAAGEALVAVGYARYGAPTWSVVTVWMNAANSAALVAVFVYIALGARSAAVPPAARAGGLAVGRSGPG